MRREDVEAFFNEQTFNPFVVTTVDGFALPVSSRTRALIGLRVIAVQHGGIIYTIPFSAIAHISEQGEHIG